MWCIHLIGHTYLTLCKITSTCLLLLFLFLFLFIIIIISVFIMYYFFVLILAKIARGQQFGQCRRNQ